MQGQGVWFPDSGGVRCVVVSKVLCGVCIGGNI